MQSVSTDQSHYVVQHANLPQFIAKRYSGWHATSPALLALALITILASALTARVHSAALGLLDLAMIGLMLGAAGLALVSFFTTGELIEARFDATGAVARLQFRGPFAHTEQTVPFSQIRGVRMAVRYDEQGRKVSVPTLDLANGRRITLPPSTTWSDIDAIRAMITDEIDEVAEAWARKSSNAALAYGRNRQRGRR
ncbi:MAG TPA: hypothetical protein P5114_14015 [Hyphomicrobiaceae bacterium]|nr:hypothetical protein [Hyphomicrobiaceae bacterium]